MWATQVKCGLLTSAEGRGAHPRPGNHPGRFQGRAACLQPKNTRMCIPLWSCAPDTPRVGDVGKSCTPPAARNDQCNVDMKLYVKQQAHRVAALIDTFCATTLQRVAEENPWMMPGYTHLQRAQVVTFKYHLLAYCEMMLRDKNAC